jgi:two-component system, OmpR family, copper resistance phosphate regulon response regulator CusR
MRILVVEDEPAMNELIVKKLESEHYSVDSCSNGADALDYFFMTEYDAVVLDIMLPKLNGLEFLHEIRSKNSTVPILLLTALDSIENRVKGLDAGADDYLVKPFAFDELLARIRVLIRRSNGQTSNILTFEDLSIDCDSRKVTRNNTEIELSAKEFAILEYFMHNPDIVLSREKICRHIWNYDYEGGSNVVDVFIRYLRKKIDEDYDTKLIHTIRGAGYVLRCTQPKNTDH